MRDSWIYVFHALFYACFLPRVLGRRRGQEAAEPLAAAGSVAPFSRLLVGLHGLAFFVLYSGVGSAVFGRAHLLGPRHPFWGGAVIVAGMALVAWALSVFGSWRLAARVDRGHELTTAGPFGFVRHPIYLAMDLLALGTLLWIPNLLVLVGCVGVALGGDLRARAEERVLLVVFGDRYREYGRRVKRFLPGIY